MVKKVGKNTVGNAANWVSKEQVDAAAARLTHEDIGELEPEMQDLLKLGTEKLDLYQRQDLLEALGKQVDSREAKAETRKQFWAVIRERFDTFFGAVQTFIRQEKSPTRFTLPPLGQGERIDLWSQRMSRVLQSWRRGRRVDVTVRKGDDGALTLYFDDFGELDKPITFATRVTQQGALFSVDYQPGQGELERVLGDDAREQLRAFFQMVMQDDRGHKDDFHRFIRRMGKNQKRAVAV